MEIRAPAFAGRLYPESPDGLGLMVDTLLADGQQGERPLGLVVPHEGLAVSGPVAAAAYARARGHDYDLIVLLGVNHNLPGFNLLSVYAGDGCDTPLGRIEVDKALALKLIASGRRFVFLREVHQREHSIEVQIPFVQRAFPGVPVLPIVVAHADRSLCGAFGHALAKALRGRRPLIVMTSNLSEGCDHVQARALDAETLRVVSEMAVSPMRAVLARRGPSLSRASGEAPLMAGLVTLRDLGAWRTGILGHATSGETAFGDPAEVTGFGALAFMEGEPGWDESALPVDVEDDGGALSPDELGALRALAWRSLERFFQTGTPLWPRDEGGALFRRVRPVTVRLHRAGQVRAQASTAGVPLGSGVAATVLRAGFAEAEPPLDPSELDGLRIEITSP